MGTDYVDVFNLHGVYEFEYKHAREVIVPALLEQKAKGKIRHLGITENPIDDHTNAMLKSRAARSGVGGVHGGLPHAAPGRARQRVPGDEAKAASARF